MRAPGVQNKHTDTSEIIRTKQALCSNDHLYLSRDSWKKKKHKTRAKSNDIVLLDGTPQSQ